MGALGDLSSLASVALVGAIVYIGYNAVGGAEGIKNLTQGIGGFFSGITGAFSGGSQTPVSYTGVPLPTAGDLAAIKIKENLEAGMDQCEAELKAFAETGLMDPSLYDSALASCREQHGNVYVPGISPEQPAATTQPAQTPEYQKAVAQFYSGGMSIQDLTKALGSEHDARAIAAQQGREREAAEQAAREAQPSGTGRSSSMPSGSLATYEQNVAFVEQIRIEQGNAAADNAAMFLRL